MKIFNFISLLFCLLITCSSYAQRDIALIHNWMPQGRDIEWSIDQYFGKNVLHLGLNFFQNDALSPSSNLNYRAQNNGERIGLHIAYMRSIQLPDSAIELLPQLKTQFFRLRDVSIIDNDRVLSAPYLHWRTTIGFVGKVKLYQQIYLVGNAAGGIVYFPSQKGFPKVHNYLLTTNFAVGLSYRLR